MGPPAHAFDGKDKGNCKGKSLGHDLDDGRGEGKSQRKGKQCTGANNHRNHSRS